jgi:addiction module RelE/StbE family toxin
MQIKYHKEFQKSYKKRIAPNPKLVAQFQKQLTLFLKNPENPTLKDHKLVGKKLRLRAFSITGDIRVVYKIVNDELWLFDIGSHNQVY